MADTVTRHRIIEMETKLEQARAILVDANQSLHDPALRQAARRLQAWTEALAKLAWHGPADERIVVPELSET